MANILIAAVVLAVYFLTIRPNQALKECERFARQEAVTYIDAAVEPDEKLRQQMQRDYEELSLHDCLDGTSE